MARIVQQKLSNSAFKAFKQNGIKLKNFKTADSFENELKKFLIKNHVLRDTINIVGDFKW